jgi:hypothetical protein
MYGDASGNIGDLSGNFSDAGGGSGEVSAADINANIDASIDAALNSSTAPSTAPSVSPSDALDALDAFAAANLAGFNAPSNVLGSDLAGGWTDSSGRGVVSQGMNISMGLDPTHGPIGPYAGTNPNTANPEALNQVANTLGISLDALLALAGRDEFGVRDPSQMSVSGLDRGTLDAMSAAGYGGLNITDNQTVDQALAAFNVSDAMDYAFPGLANAMVPGFSTLSSVSKALVGLHQGYLTPGQALAQIGLGLLSGKTNIPEGALQQAFGGQYGPLAGGIAQSGLAGLIGNTLGVPAGLVNMGLGAAGVGKSVAGALSDLKGPDLLGPSLDSVGTTTASTDTGASTATGDAGGASGDTSGGTSGDTSGGTSGGASGDTTSGGSANPFGILGLAGLLGGSSGSKDEENKNAADVRRGIAMTPYGTLYGEQNV